LTFDTMWEKYRFCLLSVPIILFLAFLLRLWNLTYSPALAHDEGIHLGQSYELLLGNAFPGLRRLTYNYQGNVYHLGFVPFALVAFFFSILGVGVFQARLASILIDTASTYLVYSFGSRLFSRRVGLLASFLYAINWLAIYSSRRFTQDAYMSFFIVLGLYVWWFGKGKAKTMTMALSGTLLGLGVLCKLSGAAFLFIILATYLIESLMKRRFESPKRILFIPLAFSVIVVLLWFAPGLLLDTNTVIGQVFRYSITTRAHWVQPQTFSGLMQSFVSLFLTYQEIFIYLLLLCLAAVFGLVNFLRKRNTAGIFLTVWILAFSAIILRGFSVFGVAINYFTSILPPISMLTSSIILELPVKVPNPLFERSYRKLSRKKTVALGLFLLILAIQASYGLTMDVRLIMQASTEPFEVADWISANVPASSKIVGSPKIAFLCRDRVFYDYYGGVTTVIRGPEDYELNYELMKSVNYIVIDEHFKWFPGINRELRQFLETNCTLSKTIGKTDIYSAN